MRRKTLPLVLGAIAVTLAARAVTRAEQPPAIEWRTDLARAREEARDARRPLFLVFRCEA
jgi:hypothetical protein